MSVSGWGGITDVVNDAIKEKRKREEEARKREREIQEKIERAKVLNRIKQLSREAEERKAEEKRQRDIQRRIDAARIENERRITPTAPQPVTPDAPDTSRFGGAQQQVEAELQEERSRRVSKLLQQERDERERERLRSTRPQQGPMFPNPADVDESRQPRTTLNPAYNAADEYYHAFRLNGDPEEDSRKSQRVYDFTGGRLTPYSWMNEKYSDLSKPPEDKSQPDQPTPAQKLASTYVASPEIRNDPQNWDDARWEQELPTVIPNTARMTFGVPDPDNPGRLMVVNPYQAQIDALDPSQPDYQMMKEYYERQGWQDLHQYAELPAHMSPQKQELVRLDPRFKPVEMPTERERQDAVNAQVPGFQGPPQRGAPTERLSPLRDAEGNIQTPVVEQAPGDEPVLMSEEPINAWESILQAVGIANRQGEVERRELAERREERTGNPNTPFTNPTLNAVLFPYINGAHWVGRQFNKALPLVTAVELPGQSETGEYFVGDVIDVAWRSVVEGEAGEVSQFLVETGITGALTARDRAVNATLNNWGLTEIGLLGGVLEWTQANLPGEYSMSARAQEGGDFFAYVVKQNQLERTASPLVRAMFTDDEIRDIVVSSVFRQQPSERIDGPEGGVLATLATQEANRRYYEEQAAKHQQMAAEIYSTDPNMASVHMATAAAYGAEAARQTLHRNDVVATQTSVGKGLLNELLFDPLNAAELAVPVVKVVSTFGPGIGRVIGAAVDAADFSPLARRIRKGKARAQQQPQSLVKAVAKAQADTPGTVRRRGLVGPLLYQSQLGGLEGLADNVVTNTYNGIGKVVDNPMIQFVRDVLQTGASKGIEDAGTNFNTLGFLGGYVTNSEDMAMMVDLIATNPEMLLNGVPASMFQDTARFAAGGWIADDGKVYVPTALWATPAQLDAAKSMRLLQGRLDALPSMQADEWRFDEFLSEAALLLEQAGYERYNVAKMPGMTQYATDVKVRPGRNGRSVVNYYDSDGDLLYTTEVTRRKGQQIAANWKKEQGRQPQTTSNLARAVGRFHRRITSTVLLDLAPGTWVTNASGAALNAMMDGTFSMKTLDDAVEMVVRHNNGILPNMRLQEGVNTSGQFSDSFLRRLRNIRAGDTQIMGRPFGEEAMATMIYATAWDKAYSSNVMGGGVRRMSEALSGVGVGASNQERRKIARTLMEIQRHKGEEAAVKYLDDLIAGRTKYFSLGDINPNYEDLFRDPESVGRIYDIFSTLDGTPEGIKRAQGELRELFDNEMERVTRAALNNPYSPSRRIYTDIEAQIGIDDYKQEIDTLVKQGVLQPQEAQEWITRYTNNEDAIREGMLRLHELTLNEDTARGNMILQDVFWRTQDAKTARRHELDQERNAIWGNNNRRRNQREWAYYRNLAEEGWEETYSNIMGMIDEAEGWLRNPETMPQERIYRRNERWGDIYNINRQEQAVIAGQEVRSGARGRSRGRTPQPIEAARKLEDRARQEMYQAARANPSSDSLDHIISAEADIEHAGMIARGEHQLLNEQLDDVMNPPRGQKKPTSAQRQKALQDYYADRNRIWNEYTAYVTARARAGSQAIAFDTAAKPVARDLEYEMPGWGTVRVVGPGHRKNTLRVRLNDGAEMSVPIAGDTEIDALRRNTTTGRPTELYVPKKIADLVKRSSDKQNELVREQVRAAGKAAKAASGPGRIDKPQLIGLAQRGRIAENIPTEGRSVTLNEALTAYARRYVDPSLNDWRNMTRAQAEQLEDVLEAEAEAYQSFGAATRPARTVPESGNARVQAQRDVETGINQGFVVADSSPASSPERWQSAGRLLADEGYQLDWANARPIGQGRTEIPVVQTAKVPTPTPEAGIALRDRGLPEIGRRPDDTMAEIAGVNRIDDVPTKTATSPFEEDVAPTPARQQPPDDDPFWRRPYEADDTPEGELRKSLEANGYSRADAIDEAYDIVQTKGNNPANWADEFDARVRSRQASSRPPQDAEWLPGEPVAIGFTQRGGRLSEFRPREPIEGNAIPEKLLDDISMLHAWLDEDDQVVKSWMTEAQYYLYTDLLNARAWAWAKENNTRPERYFDFHLKAIEDDPTLLSYGRAESSSWGRSNARLYLNSDRILANPNRTPDDVLDVLIHETAHAFLFDLEVQESLMKKMYTSGKYDADEMAQVAPGFDDVLDRMFKLREWAGVDATQSSERLHENFANGFVRYMRYRDSKLPDFLLDMYESARATLLNFMLLFSRNQRGHRWDYWSQRPLTREIRDIMGNLIGDTQAKQLFDQPLADALIGGRDKITWGNADVPWRDVRPGEAEDFGVLDRIGRRASRDVLMPGTPLGAAEARINRFANRLKYRNRRNRSKNNPQGWGQVSADPNTRSMYSLDPDMPAPQQDDSTYAFRGSATLRGGDVPINVVGYAGRKEGRSQVYVDQEPWVIFADTLTGYQVETGPSVPTEFPSSFTTRLGSVYEIDQTGRTRRTKNSPGPGQGNTFEPMSVLYVEPQYLENVTHFVYSEQAVNTTVNLGIVRDGRAYIWRLDEPIVDSMLDGDYPVIIVRDLNDNGRVKRIFPATTQPQVGYAPVEVGFRETEKRVHVGKQIVDIQMEAAPQPIDVTTTPVEELRRKFRPQVDDNMEVTGVRQAQIPDARDQYVTVEYDDLMEEWVVGTLYKDISGSVQGPQIYGIASEEEAYRIANKALEVAQPQAYGQPYLIDEDMVRLDAAAEPTQPVQPEAGYKPGTGVIQDGTGGRQAQGHQFVFKGQEYFVGPDNALYRADMADPLDQFGYRRATRVASAEKAPAEIERLRPLSEASADVRTQDTGWLEGALTEPELVTTPPQQARAEAAEQLDFGEVQVGDTVDTPRYKNVVVTAIGKNKDGKPIYRFTDADGTKRKSLRATTVARGDQAVDVGPVDDLAPDVDEVLDETPLRVYEEPEVPTMQIGRATTEEPVPAPQLDQPDVTVEQTDVPVEKPVLRPTAKTDADIVKNDLEGVGARPDVEEAPVAQADEVLEETPDDIPDEVPEIDEETYNAVVVNTVKQYNEGKVDTKVSELLDIQRYEDEANRKLANDIKQLELNFDTEVESTLIDIRGRQGALGYDPEPADVGDLVVTNSVLNKESNLGVHNHSINEFIEMQRRELQTTYNALNQRLATAAQTTPQTPFSSMQQGQQARNQLRRTMAQIQAEAVAAANYTGKEMMSLGVLDYTREYHPDVLMSVIFPYHFFASRMGKNMIERYMAEPRATARLYAMARAEEREEAQDETNLSRLEGTVGGPNIGGTEWRVRNPLWKYIMFLPKWHERGFNNPDAVTNVQKTFQALSNYGFSPYPTFDIAADVGAGQGANFWIGNLGQIGAAVGWGGIALAQQMGAENAGLQGPAQYATPHYYPYLVARELTNMAQRGEISEQDMYWAMDRAFQAYSGAEPMYQQSESSNEALQRAIGNVSREYAYRMGFSWLTGVSLAPISDAEKQNIDEQRRAYALRNSSQNPTGAWGASQAYLQGDPELAQQMSDLTGGEVGPEFAETKPGALGRAALGGVMQEPDETTGLTPVDRPGVRAVERENQPRLEQLYREKEERLQQVATEAKEANPDITTDELEEIVRREEQLLDAQIDATRAELDEAQAMTGEYQGPQGEPPFNPVEEKIFKAQSLYSQYAYGTDNPDKPQYPGPNAKRSEYRKWQKERDKWNKEQYRLYLADAMAPGMDGSPGLSEEEAKRYWNMRQLADTLRDPDELRFMKSVDDAMGANYGIRTDTALENAKARGGNVFYAKLSDYLDLEPGSEERQQMRESDPDVAAAVAAAYNPEAYDAFIEEFGAGSFQEYSQALGPYYELPAYPGEGASDAQWNAYNQARAQFYADNPEFRKMHLHYNGRYWQGQPEEDFFRPVDGGEDVAEAEQLFGEDIWDIMNEYIAASASGNYFAWRDANPRKERLRKLYNTWLREEQYVEPETPTTQVADMGELAMGPQRPGMGPEATTPMESPGFQQPITGELTDTQRMLSEPSRPTPVGGTAPVSPFEPQSQPGATTLDELSAVVAQGGTPRTSYVASQRRSYVRNKWGEDNLALWDAYFDLPRDSDERREYRRANPIVSIMVMSAYNPGDFAIAEESFELNTMLTWASRPPSGPERTEYWNANPEAFKFHNYMIGRPQSQDESSSESDDFEWDWGEDYRAAQDRFGENIWDLVVQYRSLPRGTGARSDFIDQYPQYLEWQNWWYANLNEDGDSTRAFTSSFRPWSRRSWGGGSWGGGGGFDDSLKPADGRIDVMRMAPTRMYEPRRRWTPSYENRRSWTQYMPNRRLLSYPPRRRGG